jgi:uracil-DNA glycosylase
MSSLEKLIEQVQQEAEKEPFPIDIPIYEAAEWQPTKPILYAGHLKSELCFFARDLGKDEIYARQPLYGAAGTLVRKGLYRALYGKETDNKKELETICSRVFLTNTVPYKPPGNKAYSAEVKRRFRPFLERLLVLHWQGKQIITLGNEAFDWFTYYEREDEITRFFKKPDRYNDRIEVTLKAKDEEGRSHQKTVTLMPLPHPSPLNQKYYAIFPQLLRERLNNFVF